MLVPLCGRSESAGNLLRFRGAYRGFSRATESLPSLPSFGKGGSKRTEGRAPSASFRPKGFSGRIGFRRIAVRTTAMRTDEFDFELPGSLIAQHPMSERDASRLLVFDRNSERYDHLKFADLPSLLRPGDLVVANSSKVIPARLHAVKTPSGGRLEILLSHPIDTSEWWCLLRPAKRVPIGSSVTLVNRNGGQTPITAILKEKTSDGLCRLQFSGTADLTRDLSGIGQVPLPPYICRDPNGEDENDAARYQTIYAREPGSIAAPTAGLHFTNALIASLRAMNVAVHYITLHVGIGTFAPVKSENITGHPMHEERFELSPSTAAAINSTKAAGGRIFAVGTTTTRVLESVATANGGQLIGSSGRTRIFIHPPFCFQIVDALITNFHLPRSTLLMLASAFADPGGTHGRERILQAYQEAIERRYRFFSFGDAMVIL